MLVIAGEGREGARLRQMADIHLPGRVRFVGRIPRKEMRCFYSAGDMFAFPGIRESLGMVYLEAQSCGLPVVAFNNGGIPEVVRDGETAILTPMVAADPFARAMARLLGSRELRRTMGAAAARYVRTHHDLNENYREMERILLNIAECQASRVCSQ